MLYVGMRIVKVRKGQCFRIYDIQELRESTISALARFWKISLEIEVFLGQLAAMAYSMQDYNGPEENEALTCCHSL